MYGIKKKKHNFDGTLYESSHVVYFYIFEAIL